MRGHPTQRLLLELVEEDSGLRAPTDAADPVGQRQVVSSPFAVPDGTTIGMRITEIDPEVHVVFSNGAFVAAKRARVPIVPVLLEGMGQAWPPGTLVVEGRHELRIAVLGPIERDQIERDAVEQLSALARARIEHARKKPAATAPADTGPAA